jgi:tetratricopeptide (TPR) repeat protein
MGNGEGSAHLFTIHSVHPDHPHAFSLQMSDSASNLPPEHEISAASQVASEQREGPIKLTQVAPDVDDDVDTANIDIKNLSVGSIVKLTQVASAASGAGGGDDVPFPKAGVRITVFRKFIEDFGGIDKFKGLTTGDVTDGEAAGFVLKATQERKCSYCELLEYQGNADVGIATVFISHACGQDFLDVVDALENHFKADSDVFVWFSSFSNNQHLTPNLPFEWFTNTFKSAISDFGHTVMVLAPWNNPIPFTRAWCLFEVYSTVVTTSKFEVAMSESERKGFIKSICYDTSLFYKMLADIDVSKSQSWLPDDLARIKEVAEAEVGLDKLNLIVKGKMREWVEATLKNSTQHNDGEGHVYNEEELDRMLALATNLRDTGQYHASFELYQKCLSGYLALPGWSPDDIRLGKVYNNMANSHKDLREYDLALTNYTKGLNIKLKNKGASSAFVGIAYNNMAGVYQQQQKYDLALEYYSKALRIELTLGENHPGVSNVYHSMAIMYNQQQKYDLALKFSRRR